MDSYPVHYQVDKPSRWSRLQLAVRLVAFLALGVLGLSFGMVFLFLYFALPAFAASRSADDPEAYLETDGPRVLRVLAWVAAVSAWAGLICESLPGKEPDRCVHISVDRPSHPTGTTALARVLFGIPSAIVFAILCWVGFFVWLWAALSILLWERVGHRAFRYLEGLQRWSIRLLAYQASLVDEYPPFSFHDAPAGLPEAKLAER